MSVEDRTQDSFTESKGAGVLAVQVQGQITTREAFGQDEHAP